MNIKFTKNWPNNPHQNYYKNWEYLGSDDDKDYYYLNNSALDLLADKHALSIVCSNEPSDYMSPSIRYLTGLDCYVTLGKLLFEKGVL